MAAKILANLLVMGSGIMVRAFVQAYRQALANASKSGVAQETIHNTVRRSKTMVEQEARQILGVCEKATWEEILLLSHSISGRFHDLNQEILDVFPLKEVELSEDLRDQIELMKKQSKWPKFWVSLFWARFEWSLWVNIEVKVTAGSPMKKVILQEVIACNATWVVLDRHLRRDLKHYLKHIPCKVAFFQDNLSVEVLRPYATTVPKIIDQKLFYSVCKPVPLPVLDSQDDAIIEQSVISCRSYFASISSLESTDILKSNLLPSSRQRSREHNFTSDDFGSSSKQEKSGTNAKGENINPTVPQIFPKQRKNMFKQKSSESPILCTACGTRTGMYIKESMRISFSEIQLATNEFSKKNLLGEGGYGHVYKGELRDGQLIAAKVHKEASAQGFTEFHSEVYVLSFAHHKNIIMLLGYCCKENINILVYEYICNKSLEWHLFENNNTKTVLEWHHRHAIAIGAAKGLRFLHEECRGGPIIHRDMRPSNILLTHDYVPMLGDFGLAKWRTSDDPVHTRIFGTLGYLAPEYAENGIVSVRTDVYAFGIVLLQLISGRKVVAAKGEDRQQSLQQWAEPLIERLALHELIDPRIAESYDMHELYLMARTTYLCVQSKPEMRPSMGEVVRLLEGESDHFRYLSEQFLPHYAK